MMQVINLVMGLFSGKDSSRNIVIMVVMLMVIMPSIYFLYTGVSNILYNVFNIKTDKEIIIEKQNIISDVLLVNKDLHKVIIINNRVSELDMNTTLELHNGISYIEINQVKTINDIVHIDEYRYEELHKELDTLTKVVNKEQVVVTPIDKIDIKVDKTEYSISGLNNFNIIMGVYNDTKDIK